MTQIPFDCPHVGCRVANHGTDVIGATSTGANCVTFFLKCTSCDRGIMAVAEPISGKMPKLKHPDGRPAISQGRQFFEDWCVVNVYPEPPKAQSVEYMPQAVCDALAEAEDHFATGRYPSTVALTYRRTLELALKDKYQDLTGTLGARIKDVRQQNAIPETLIRLMETVTWLGNDGAHDPAPPSFAELQTGRDFTILLLTYLYELPGKVTKAAEDRRERKATS